MPQFAPAPSVQSPTAWQRVKLAISTGATLVGWIASGANAVLRTATAKLRDHINSADYGVVADGVTNDTAAYGAATTAVAKNNLTLMSGVMLSDAQVVTEAQHVRGLGWSATSTQRPGATMLKRANGTHLDLTGDHASASHLHLDGATPVTGDGVKLSATRQQLLCVSSTKQAGDGFRIGGAGATGVFNANIWSAIRPIARSNGGRGCYIHHSGGTVTAQFPNGVPDCNAGLMLGADFGLNTGIGLSVDNTIDNVFVGVVAQSNTGKGVVLSADSKGNKFFGLYAEANNGGAAGYGDEVDILAGAYNNLIIGARTTGTGSGSGIRDANAPTQNLIWVYEFPLSGYALRGALKVWNELTDATGADLQFYKGTGQANVVNHRHTLSGTSGGKYVLQVKIDGGAVTDRHTVIDNGDQTFAGCPNGYLFGGKTLFNTTQTGTFVDGAAGRINIINSGAGVKTVEAFYDASGAAGSITTSGAGVTAYLTTSDARKKVDRGPVGNLWAAFELLPVRRMAMKAGGDEFVGFYAQDMQKIAPHAVAVGEDGYLQADYAKMVPYLWHLVGELKQEIEALKNERKG